MFYLFLFIIGRVKYIIIIYFVIRVRIIIITISVLKQCLHQIFIYLYINEVLFFYFKKHSLNPNQTLFKIYLKHC
jgi:hypothetical protein